MYVLPKLLPEEILLYLRKSQSDDPLLSVEEVLARHEQMLDDWVAQNLPGLGPVPEKNRIREVVSGETIDGRPGMLDLLRRIESPKIKAVLSVEPQRLSRGSLKDIGHLVELLRYSNTLVLTRRENYDLRDNRDRELFERELMRGNEYLEYYKRIQQNGRLLSVQNGNYIGQHAPYGYKKITIGEGRNKCYTLEPIPDEAEAVKIMFSMYRNGWGAVRIADQLHEMGYFPRSGGFWADNTIRGILKNEHYIGKVRWNHKQTKKTVVDGEVVAKRSICDDYLVFPGKQPAIIDIETWDAVQARFGTIPRNNKVGNLSNPLSGLLFCSCGRAMRRHTFVHKGVEKAEPRYQCPKQKHCENASCIASEIMAEIKRTLAETLEDFEVRAEKKEDDTVELHRQRVKHLEDRLERILAREVAQWDKYTREDMPKEVFDQLNKRVLEEKEEVQQALCVARDSVPEPVNFEEKIATFRALLDLMDDPDAPVKELNMMLKTCIERITYSRPKKKTNARWVTWETGNPFELGIKLRV